MLVSNGQHLCVLAFATPHRTIPVAWSPQGLPSSTTLLFLFFFPAHAEDGIQDLTELYPYPSLAVQTASSIQSPATAQGTAACYCINLLKQNVLGWARFVAQWESISLLLLHEALDPDSVPHIEEKGGRGRRGRIPETEF